MALMKSKGEREIALLEQLEQQIARREKRQRYLRVMPCAAATRRAATVADPTTCRKKKNDTRLLSRAAGCLTYDSLICCCFSY